MRPSPTLIDAIDLRAREIDKAIGFVLACADDLPKNGAPSLIPQHLHHLRARIAALRADMACLVALAYAGQHPAPSDPSTAVTPPERVTP